MTRRKRMEAHVRRAMYVSRRAHPVQEEAMDPDKALELMQKKMERIKRLIDNNTDDNTGRIADETVIEDLVETANEAVDVWNGLDRWMREAGALPRDWSRHR